MVQNLKRKHRGSSGPRKESRVKEPGEITVSRSTIDQGDESEPEAFVSEDEGEWGGIAVKPILVPPEDHLQTNKKAPTGEELRNIKDASELFKSSSFKLQIDALLPNVRPKPSKIPPLERFLFNLYSFLKELPPVPPQHPLEASRKLRELGVAVPYPLPLPTEETNWKVSFKPPNDITLVGSWANKLSVKAKDGKSYGVDLAAEMPNELFQEKDYLNGRFFHKRAFYMATIASAIQQSKTLKVDVAYSSLGEDCRLTKLVVCPRNDGSSADFTKLNAEVCILPVTSLHCPIPLHRLSPAHSNLRLNTSTTEDENQVPIQLPSPLYNNALLRIFTPKPQLLSIHAVQNDCPSFTDALTLLRVWANQRGYGAGSRMCVRGFEAAGSLWSSVLMLLLHGEETMDNAGQAGRRRTVGKGVSSYQLFKAALEFLAKHNFEQDSVFVKSNQGHRYLPEEYKNHHQAVFVDSTSLTNLLAAVPLGSLDLLRYDAAKTLNILNQITFSGDPFTNVFLKDSRDLWTRLDVIIRVNVALAKPQSSSIHATLEAGSPVPAVLSSMGSLLGRGLGDRCCAVTILHPSSSSRPTSQAHPLSPEIIFIGIILNPQNAFRLVDHGPAADDQDQDALEQFRQLWGDKSELRRFKDGRIVESVVWEVTTADERAHVPSMIVRYLLKRHFSLDAVETWQSSFDNVLRLPSSISRHYLSSDVSTGFKGVLSAFDNLVKSIKGLDKELPLSILTVSPISESLRYMSVFSPVPLSSSLATILPPNARYLPALDIVLEFEKSSRWPDELKGIQVIKLAFFERLATSLMQAVNGLTAKVVTGDGITESVIIDKSVLEIVTPEGWAFAVHIWHDREVDLLDRVIDGTSKKLPHVVPNKEDRKTREHYEALEAKEVYLRRFVHAPRHHRAIAALCHHYSAFSGTVRLVKRWLASHWLLRSHMTEESVELICASLFLSGGQRLRDDVDLEQKVQHLVPGSKERGFVAVVEFLKDWKWEEGLFVPLYGDATSTSPNDAVSAGGGGTSVWRIRSEHDPEGHVWTYNGPDLVVAHRVKALANATWNLLQGMENGQFNVQGLFIHPTDDYDFVIQLDRLVLSRYLHNVCVDPDLLTKRRKYANGVEADEITAVLPGFDPAYLLFSDLQRVYSETFKIFYDPFGGDKFGCVWHPNFREPRAFRVLGGFSSMPVGKDNGKGKDKDKVKLNQDSVIGEIQRLGLGMIQKITISK